MWQISVVKMLTDGHQSEAETTGGTLENTVLLSIVLLNKKSNLENCKKHVSKCVNHYHFFLQLESADASVCYKQPKEKYIG